MLSKHCAVGRHKDLRVTFQDDHGSTPAASDLFRRPQSPPVVQRVQDALDGPLCVSGIPIPIKSILKRTPSVEVGLPTIDVSLDASLPTRLAVKNAIYSVLNDTRLFNPYHSISLAVIVDTLYKDLHLNEALDPSKLREVKYVSSLVRGVLDTIDTEESPDARGPYFERNSLTLINALHYLQEQFKSHPLFCTIQIFDCTDSSFFKDYTDIELINDSFLEIMNGYPDINEGSSELFFNDPNSDDTGYVEHDAFVRTDHDLLVEQLRDLLVFTKPPISEDVGILKHHAYIVRRVLKKINYEEKNTTKTNEYFSNKVALYNALYTLHKEFQKHQSTKDVKLIATNDNPQFFTHYSKRDRIALNDLFQSDEYGDITKPFITTEHHRFVFHNSQKIDADKRHADQVGEGSFGRLRDCVFQDLSEPDGDLYLDVVKKVRPRHLMEHFTLYRELKVGKELNDTTIALGAFDAFSYDDSKKYSRSNIGLLMSKAQHISLNSLLKGDRLKRLSDYIFQSAVRLGQLHNNGLSHGDFCMENTLNVGDDHNLIVRLSDLGEIKCVTDDIRLLRLDKKAALGHFPSPELIEWAIGNQETIDFKKHDTFSWAVDILYRCTRLELIKDFPVYESDYSLKGSQDGLEKNKVFEWTRQAIMALERYANILGSEPLKHALISALQPIDCRLNMDELCRFLLTPPARESLESL